MVDDLPEMEISGFFLPIKVYGIVSYKTTALIKVGTWVTYGPFENTVPLQLAGIVYTP
jgi:hypothetical protein